MQPSKWGKHMWYSIHFVALGYPENPTPLDKEYYKSFYNAVGKVLPCEKCAKNFERHSKELPIDSFLVNRKQLFTWTVMFHNIVNQELGKKEWTVDEAWEFYNSDKIVEEESGPSGKGLIEMFSQHVLSPAPVSQQQTSLDGNKSVHVQQHKKQASTACGAPSLFLIVNSLLLVVIVGLLMMLIIKKSKAFRR